MIFDDELAAEARDLGINGSEAAREALRQAVRRRRRRADRDRDREACLAHPGTEACLAYPGTEADPWDQAESWGET